MELRKNFSRDSNKQLRERFREHLSEEDVTQLLANDGQLLLTLLQKRMAYPNEDRRKMIFMHLFGLDGRPTKSVSELAAMFRITAQRIHQLRAKTIQDLCNLYRTHKVQNVTGGDLLCYELIDVFSAQGSLQAFRIFDRAKIRLVGELVQMTPDSLRLIPGCGRKTIAEFHLLLRRINLSLDMNVSDEMKQSIADRRQLLDQS